MKKFLSVMCLTTLLLSFALPVSANSAQMFWYGVDSTGTVIVGGESPIVVEHEQLVFDIPEGNSFGYAAKTTMKLSSKKLQSLGWEPTVNLKEMYIRMLESL